MKRKTSTIPSRVYKYALLPPIERAEEVDASFLQADDHYNRLIGIELDRRVKYRTERARMFPALAAAEAAHAEIEERLAAQRAAISANKSTTRSRVVDDALAAAVAETKAARKASKDRLHEERDKCESVESLAVMVALKEAEKAGADAVTLKVLRQELKSERDKTPIGQIGNRIREEAREKIKALRSDTYWGTYLLVEVAAQSAAASRSDPEFNDIPTYQLSNRIGVHINGGMGIDDLGSSTLVQISPMPVFTTRKSGAVFARGKAARTTLRFRIGTEGRAPKWAVFPMIMHRPLPKDARIKDAYVTRRPCSVRIPWRYSLCIVLESREFERSQPGIEQEGTTAINFGWRLTETGELRVAQINSETRGLSEIRLPARYVSGIAKCRELQSLLDEKFDSVRDTLAAWIGEHSELPPAFLAEFQGLPQWRSQHRLAELVWYWTSHRIDSDGDIFPLLAEWLGQYRHLGDWIVYQRRKLLDWRTDFYRREAKRLATTSASLAIDTFQIADIARRPKAEIREEGGELARRNRQLAAPGELRLTILHAASKYHCETVAAETKNGTRRCNMCGEVCPEAIVELIHNCTNIACPAQWDQDANNTNNLQDAVSSGAVTPLVQPAHSVKNGAIVPSMRTNFKDARKAVRNLLTTQ